MGVSISKNTVQSMINDSNSIISTYENTCTSKGTSTVAQVKIQGCDFGNNNTIKVEGNTNVSLQCIQSNTTTSSIQSSVEQSIRQTAKAVTQSFGFPTVTDAENFISDSVILGTQIVNYYYNTCIAETTSSNVGFTCEPPSKFGNGNVIEVKAFTDVTATCLQNNKDINAIISKLTTNLDNTALSKSQGIFELFVIIFVVIIIALAYAGISLAESPLVEYGILFLVLASIISTVVYTITTRKNNNYPYIKK